MGALAELSLEDLLPLSSLANTTPVPAFLPHSPASHSKLQCINANKKVPGRTFAERGIWFPFLFSRPQHNVPSVHPGATGICSLSCNWPPLVDLAFDKIDGGTLHWLTGKRLPSLSSFLVSYEAIHYWDHTGDCD